MCRVRPFSVWSSCAHRSGKQYRLSNIYAFSVHRIDGICVRIVHNYG